jgi:hypothetical protein
MPPASIVGKSVQALSAAHAAKAMTIFKIRIGSPQQFERRY